MKNPDLYMERGGGMWAEGGLPRDGCKGGALWPKTDISSTDPKLGVKSGENSR